MTLPFLMTMEDEGEEVYSQGPIWMTVVDDSGGGR